MTRMGVLLVPVGFLVSVSSFGAGGGTDGPMAAAHGTISSSRDSDGLRIDRAGAGAFLRYAREGDATGMRIERGRYAQDDWRRRIEAVTVLHRDTDRRTAEGLRLATTLSRQGGHRLLGADIDWSRELRPGTRVGALYARDWVETREALQAGLRYDMAGASIDQAVGRFTVVGFYAAQRFSDGNVRHHYRARFIAPLAEAQGLTAQLRVRGFVSEDPDVARRYFNPRRYDQALFVLALRRRFDDGITLLAEAGAGRQRIAAEGTSPATHARLSLGKVFDSGAALRLEAQHARSASLAGPGYRYRSVAIEGELPF